MPALECKRPQELGAESQYFNKITGNIYETKFSIFGHCWPTDNETSPYSNGN